MTEILEMGPDHTQSAAATMLDPSSGWPPSAFIDGPGMETVWKLRSELTGAEPAMPAAGYFTLEPYTRVMSLGLVPAG